MRPMAIFSVKNGSGALCLACDLQAERIGAAHVAPPVGLGEPQSSGTLAPASIEQTSRDDRIAERTGFGNGR